MQGYLWLADGTIFEGELLGAATETEGEVVFSTGMTGYPQTLTDPSYAGQIVVFTYPLIGNYGVPAPVIRAPHLMANFESEKIWTQAVVVSELSDIASHATNATTFDAWLKKSHIPILSGIDTRALTIKLREHGVLAGKIVRSKPTKGSSFNIAPYAYQKVSITKPIHYPGKTKQSPKIGVIDCGVKHGILRSLIQRGYSVTRIPWDMDPQTVDAFDGIVCSNGPGDPKDWGKTIENLKKILGKKIPTVGICLGHQLVALALGADTYKMKYGHRGINQPCQDITTNKCYLTSQNHGYAVKLETIPNTVESWFVNLNDGTSEGIKSGKRKLYTTQFHPEGNPGPFDSDFIFDIFDE